MQEIKDALLRMVSAGKKIKRMQEAYLKAGLDDNVLFDAYGDICNAIYNLIGEKTEEYKGSTTDIVMSAMDFISDERMMKMLMFEYRKNHQDQPKPNLMDSDGMKELYERNGGYMTPEGDWT